MFNIYNANWEGMCYFCAFFYNYSQYVYTKKGEWLPTFGMIKKLKEKWYNKLHINFTLIYTKINT